MNDITERHFCHQREREKREIEEDTCLCCLERRIVSSNELKQVEQNQTQKCIPFQTNLTLDRVQSDKIHSRVRVQGARSNFTPPFNDVPSPTLSLQLLHNDYHIVAVKQVGHGQCDQMARLFVQNLTIYNNENWPKQ